MITKSELYANVWLKNLTKVIQDLKLRNLSQAAHHVTLNLKKKAFRNLSRQKFLT